MNKDEIRRGVTGPIVSIKTPFHRDGRIDFEGLYKFIDYTIQAGSRAILFTRGDSLYEALTDQEVADLTKAAARHIGKRALFISAGKVWATGKSIEFAQFSRDAGARATIVSPVMRGMTERELVNFYAAVSKHLPVFVLSGDLAGIGMEPALKVVKMLLEEVPGIAGLKEDYCPEFARQACLLAHEQWAIFAGGQKQTHLDMLPYGCDGYMSVFMSFKPEIAHKYWSAIEAVDITKAAKIIRDYDLPMFKFLYSAFPAGGDAGQHALLELAGLCGRWRRKPLPDLSDEEMEKLKTFMEEIVCLKI